MPVCHYVNDKNSSGAQFYYCTTHHARTSSQANCWRRGQELEAMEARLYKLAKAARAEPINIEEGV